MASRPHRLLPWGQETATQARITRAVGALGERRVIGDFLLSPLCVFG